jgi:hypothetical protein
MHKINQNRCFQDNCQKLAKNWVKPLTPDDSRIVVAKYILTYLRYGGNISNAYIPNKDIWKAVLLNDDISNDVCLNML